MRMHTHIRAHTQRERRRGGGGGGGEEEGTSAEAFLHLRVHPLERNHDLICRVGVADRGDHLEYKFTSSSHSL